MSVQDRLALVIEVLFIDAHLIRVLVLRRKERYKKVGRCYHSGAPPPLVGRAFGRGAVCKALTSGRGVLAAFFY